MNDYSTAVKAQMVATINLSYDFALQYFTEIVKKNDYLYLAFIKHKQRVDQNFGMLISAGFFTSYDTKDEVDVMDKVVEVSSLYLALQERFNKE